MATRAEINRQLTRAVELVTSRIAVAVINNARNATRRDTSWHASRWVGAVGREPRSVDTPNTRAGRAAQLSFGQQASSIAAINAYRLSQGSQIIIGNDGVYIEQLDAQDNFVGPAVDRSVTVSLAGTGLTR